MAQDKHNLPVIKHCRTCAHMCTSATGSWCGIDNDSRSVRPASAPPEWCPLRGK